MGFPLIMDMLHMEGVGTLVWLSSLSVARRRRRRSTLRAPARVGSALYWPRAHACTTDRRPARRADAVLRTGLARRLVALERSRRGRARALPLRAGQPTELSG